MKAQNALKKIYKELAREAQKYDRQAAEAKEAAREIDREIKEWNRMYFMTQGLAAFNPILSLAMLTNFYREAQRLGVLKDLAESRDFKENFERLGRTIEERLELYAQAKEEGVAIDPEFEKSFKANIIDALEKMEIIDENGEQKERDSQLLKEVQRLKKELFKSAIDKKEARHAEAHEA